MGKRTLVVLTAVITLFTATYVNNGTVTVSHEGLNTLHSLTTLAQEVNAAPRVISKSSEYIIHDSAIERVSVYKPQAANPAKESLVVWATGYASVPEQTDATPFITASGTRVRDGVAAANFLPIGTRFRLPEKFGTKEFVVEDRMNSRYNNQHIVDIWFEDNTDALHFGKRMLTLEIL